MAFGTLAREAEAALRSLIKSSGLGDGGRLPSERAMAQQLGMRHYAVNRAVATLVAEGTIRRDGYKLYYSNKKSVLPSEQSFACHVVISQGSIHRASYLKLAKELEMKIELHSWGSTEEAVAMLQELDSPKTEAVIFDPPHSHTNSDWETPTRRLALHGIPIIIVGQPLDGVSSIVAGYPEGLSLLVEHFLELGHRELAFATASPWAPLSIQVFNAWKPICDQHGIPGSATHIYTQPNPRILPEDTRELARKFNSEWSKVTAVVLFTDHEYSIQHLLNELAAQDKAVPTHLSLAFLGDSEVLRTATPPITTASYDISLIQESAFRLAQRAARKKRILGLHLPPQRIRIEPQIADRGSTAALPTRNVKAGAKSRALEPATPPQALQKCSADLDSLRRPYPKASHAVEDRFVALDLSGYVNRPLNFRRGWLGDRPLKHFEPGRHVIHGVPFQVLGGRTRSDCGAIVFQSAVNTTGKSQKLPSRLSVPIGGKVEAVYILHGCGFAKYLQTFADYTFYHQKKMAGVLPLISLGHPPANLDSAQLSEARNKANIQDWWSDFPHLDFHNSRMVPILENPEQKHGAWHAYLYTLEWTNPSPDKEISRLEIYADQSQSTTLGILSISVLRP